LLTNIEEKLAKIDRRDAIAAIFRGQFRHSITNRQKDFAQKRLEDFYDISLQVKGCANVMESLRKLTSAEQLTGDNTYDAGELGRIPVTMDIKIMKLPPVLQLHLKRFEYDLTRYSLVKIDTEFHFDQVLDMREFLDREHTETHTKYQLFGVLVHSGTAFGGHYYVYLRPECKVKWYQFNDSYVSEATTAQAISGNFGGRISTTTSTATTKIYSAYMLFYVRDDVIGNIFGQCSLDEVPQHVKQYVGERCDATGDATIGIRVYTEEGLRRNVDTVALGLTSREGHFLVGLQPNSTLYELYQAVATNLKRDIRTIRIWKFGLTSSPLDTVVEHSKIFQLSSLCTRRLFVQFKESREPLQLEPRMIVIFLKLYTKSPTAPLVYYKSIIVDSVSTVALMTAALAHPLGLNSSARFDVFKEDPGSRTAPIKRLQEAKSWTANACPNGTVVVAVPTGREVLKDHFIRLYVSSAEPVVGADPDEDGENGKIQNYFSFMENETPQKFEDYYNLKANTIDLRLYRYDTLQFEQILRVPAQRTLANLRGFVQLTMDFKGNDLLLFANKQHSWLPDLVPLTTIPVTGIDFGCLFFLEPEKGPNSNKRTVIVDRSDDGYRRTSRHAFFVDLPQDFPKIRKFMEGRLGTGRPFRVLLIRSHAIERIVFTDSDLVGFNPKTDLLRFEYIPQDQEDGSGLVKVAQVEVNTTGCFTPTGMPFFLRIAPQFTLEELRDLIQRVRRESDDMMNHLRFTIRKGPPKPYEKFDPTNQLKKDIRYRVTPSMDSILIICPADRGTVGRLEAMRITN
jgi:hypothetical protein